MTPDNAVTHRGRAAGGWRSLERDAGGLYRGLALSRARAWAATSPDAFTPGEKEFLDASARAPDSWVAGRRVASVHVDGSVRVWDCEVCGSAGQLLAVAGTRVG